MRERVLAELHAPRRRGELAPERWRGLRERIADIQISTIDAFCFGLLREFPLEADVDPGVRDRRRNRDGALRERGARPHAARRRARLIADDEHVRLLFARVKPPVLRDARRDAARSAARRAAGRGDVRRARTCGSDGAGGGGRVRRRVLRSLVERSTASRGAPRRRPARRRRSSAGCAPTSAALDDVSRRRIRRACSSCGGALERYFLTQERQAARSGSSKPFMPRRFATPAARKAPRGGARGAVARRCSRRSTRSTSTSTACSRAGCCACWRSPSDSTSALLDEHALLDFAGMLDRAVALLERQEEFARSRLKLQSRYHHVLVDEFQDTSRLQWRLVELLIDAWGEGEGVADAPTSIFIVGDRKQSIYRFRHAEVTLLDEAARKIARAAAGPAPCARRSRTASAPCRSCWRSSTRWPARCRATGRSTERFAYGEPIGFRWPAVAPGARRDGEPVLGLVAEPSMARCAQAVAAEIARLLEHGRRPRSARRRRGARGRTTSRSCSARAPDISTSRRRSRRAASGPTSTRASASSTRRKCRICRRCCATWPQPDSDLRAAEFLRSRFVRLSDVGARARWRRRLRDALRGAGRSTPRPRVSTDSIARCSIARARRRRALARARRSRPAQRARRSSSCASPRTPSRCAAAGSIRRARTSRRCAALVRRVESRGYATLGRLADYFETLRAGDESNAIVEASGAVNLMTIHAAKGLEFPDRLRRQPARARPAGERRVLGHRARADRRARSRVRPDRRQRELEDARDAEELRRLLYVAVTRARDRLYLAAEVDDDGRAARRGAQPGGAAARRAWRRARDAAACARLDRRSRGQSRDGTFAFRVVPAVEPAAPPGARARARGGPRGSSRRLSPRGPQVPVAATAVGRSSRARRRGESSTGGHDRAADRHARASAVSAPARRQRRPPSDVRLAVPLLVRGRGARRRCRRRRPLERRGVDLYLRAAQPGRTSAALLGGGTCLLRGAVLVSARTATRRTRCSCAAWSTAWSWRRTGR